MISIGPILLSCTNPTVASNCTLTDSNAQQYADTGLVFGIYCNRDHFRTYVNCNPPSFAGVTPCPIDAKDIRLCIDTTCPAGAGAMDEIARRIVHSSMRTPYPMEEMDAMYMFRYDWSDYDSTFHGCHDSWFATTTGSLRTVFEHSNVLVPDEFHHLRTTVRHMLQLEEFHIVICLMVIDGYFARGLYSALQREGGDFHQGATFVLCARNHTCFPAEYTAQLDDIIACFPYSQLPPEVRLDTAGPLFPNNPDLDAPLNRSSDTAAAPSQALGVREQPVTEPWTL